MSISSSVYTGLPPFLLPFLKWEMSMFSRMIRSFTTFAMLPLALLNPKCLSISHMDVDCDTIFANSSDEVVVMILFLLIHC